MPQRMIKHNFIKKFKIQEKIGLMNHYITSTRCYSYIRSKEVIEMAKREGEKQLNFWMDNELHRLVRIEAAKNEMNMKDYICKVLKKDLEENNKNN